MRHSVREYLMGLLMIAEERVSPEGIKRREAEETGDWRIAHRAFDPARVARRQATIDRLRGRHPGGA